MDYLCVMGYRPRGCSVVKVSPPCLVAFLLAAAGEGSWLTAAKPPPGPIEKLQLELRFEEPFSVVFHRLRPQHTAHVGAIMGYGAQGGAIGGALTAIAASEAGIMMDEQFAEQLLPNLDGWSPRRPLHDGLREELTKIPGIQLTQALKVLTARTLRP